MPKATRVKDTNETPKKQSRKTKPADGNGTEVAEPMTMAPAIANVTSKGSQVEVKGREINALPKNGNPMNGSDSEVKTTKTPTMPISEELVRRRAYELYVRRRGQNGSPEQDWFQALQEVSS